MENKHDRSVSLPSTHLHLPPLPATHLHSSLPPDSHPGWDRLLEDVLDAEEFEVDAPLFDADFGK
jgi:hypothetical protein